LAKRARILKDIGTLDHAIKAEEDVESGYHSIIDENVSHWKAVEEDVIESYTKMIETSESSEMKDTLGKIVEDSKKHKRMLDQISTMFDEIIADERKHAKMLVNLKARLEP
jgi:rubrerythrin